MIPFRIYIYAAAVAALLAALWGYGRHERAQGRAEVQATFDAYVSAQKLAQAEADKATAAESIRKFRNVERSRENDSKLEQQRKAADSVARTELDRLRSVIASGSYPAVKAGDPEAVARADEAAKVAAELLGECAARYSDVAREAGELAGQLIGLQGFVSALE